MVTKSPETSPEIGTVHWSPLKSLWFIFMAVTAVAGGAMTFSLSAVFVSFALTVITLCCGHTVGLHRLIIHRSFECPLWLERTLVYLGTMVGMGGPRRMIYLHDIRDWAQRHPSCHPFFIDAGPVWRDFWWQLNCEIRLTHPPEFQLEPRVKDDPFFRFLDRTWMIQQLPWAVALYALGGWPWAIWGVPVRVTTSVVGHWFIGYLAHNCGRRPWLVEQAAVQGGNLPGCGLLSMGEGWHNNHHAFPGSARLGLAGDQPDPGWLFLRLLQQCRLAWNIRLPEDLPPRPELRRAAP